MHLRAHRSVQLVAAVIIAFTVSSCSLLEANKSSKSGSLSIPYVKHVLDNGLTLIIHEDHSDPVAHVDVTYHVGSAREELGKSGFAHLFEHMMFQGSENVADEEHFKIITEIGGTLNGTTNNDRTNYFETVPANHLETALWLEADRMGFFLEAITQEKFEIQRATVKNEKGQNYDNRAYGRVWEKISQTLYPHGHPYSWLTIGHLEDLDRATSEDLRNFFLRWYGPNNATVTVGGDVDPKQVLALVKKYFGGIEKGPEVKPLDIPGFELTSDRYTSYYDDKIRFPAVTISFPTVPMFHPDEPALNCLSSILGRGKGSYLYQNLVASQKAIQASASHSSRELAGEFFMFVLPFPGKSLNDFEVELRTSLDQFEKNGVSEDDLQKFKAQYEANFIKGLEKVSGKVSKLAHYTTFANDPGFAQEQLKRYRAVTKEDVERVYKTYIKERPSVVVSILSSPDMPPAKPDTPLPKPSKANPYPTTNYSGLVYKKAQDDFDRSVQPKPTEAKPVTPPNYWEHTVKNGIQLLGAKSDELPKVVISINLKGGNVLDKNHPDKLGLASLAASLMNTSTENFSEKEIAEELEKLGSLISFSSSYDGFHIYVDSLSKHLDKTLMLLEEKLFKPAFVEEDFRRIQKQTIESVQAMTKQASSIAPMVYNRLLYGESHPKGTPDTYLAQTLPTLGNADARIFYDKYFSLAEAKIVIVGDISKKEILNKLDFLFKTEKPAPGDIVLPEVPRYEKTKLFFVDKPEAAQSEIRVGYLTNLKYDATGEYYKRSLMNFPLGGVFNSRINLNLREDKGVTYGARSSFRGDKQPGPFTVSTSVKSDSTALAVTEIIKEVSKMSASGITTEELSFLKQALAQQDALRYESLNQKSRFLSNIQKFSLPRGFVDTQKNIVKNIGKQELDFLAKKHLPLDNMFMLVVGDKKVVFESLKMLNYPMVELDLEGSPVR